MKLCSRYPKHLSPAPHFQSVYLFLLSLKIIQLPGLKQQFARYCDLVFKVLVNCMSQVDGHSGMLMSIKISRFKSLSMTL